MKCDTVRGNDPFICQSVRCLQWRHSVNWMKIQFWFKYTDVNEWNAMTREFFFLSLFESTKNKGKKSWKRIYNQISKQTVRKREREKEKKGGAKHLNDSQCQWISVNGKPMMKSDCVSIVVINF